MVVSATSVFFLVGVALATNLCLFQGATLGPELQDLHQRHLDRRWSSDVLQCQSHLARYVWSYLGRFDWFVSDVLFELILHFNSIFICCAVRQPSSLLFACSSSTMVKGTFNFCFVSGSCNCILHLPTGLRAVLLYILSTSLWVWYSVRIFSLFCFRLWSSSR